MSNLTHWLYFPSNCGSQSPSARIPGWELGEELIRFCLVAFYFPVIVKIERRDDRSFWFSDFASDKLIKLTIFEIIMGQGFLGPK